MTAKEAVESAYKLARISKEMGFKGTEIIFSEDEGTIWHNDLAEMVAFRGEPGPFTFIINVSLGGEYSAEVDIENDKLKLRLE